MTRVHVKQSRPGRWLVITMSGAQVVAYEFYPTHAEALSWALAETGLLRDGTPYESCGLGPCAMGHGHTGACRC